MTSARVVVLAAAVIVLGACAPDGPDVAAPPPVAVEPRQIAGLTATLEQYREDEIADLISVQTTNGSSSTVQFTDLRLEWEGLSDEAPREPRHAARAGRHARPARQPGRCRLRHAARCPRHATPGAPLAVGHAAVDGGPPELVAVPIEDRRSILPRVYRASCQAQRLAWAADLSFGDEWTPATTPDGMPAVHGTLEVARNESDAPLVITNIGGSVLLRISPLAPSDPVAVLAPDQQAATIPILVEQSGNCAAHTLAESKKTFLIPIGVAIGDEEPAADVVSFDASAKQLLNQLINVSCGVG